MCNYPLSRRVVSVSDQWFIERLDGPLEDRSVSKAHLEYECKTFITATKRPRQELRRIELSDVFTVFFVIVSRWMFCLCHLNGCLGINNKKVSAFCAGLQLSEDCEYLFYLVTLSTYTDLFLYKIKHCVYDVYCVMNTRRSQLLASLQSVVLVRDAT